jgi:hypothetical protein
MSGYAKRMMEIAAAWHRENPDPGADLRLPRSLDKFTDQCSKDIADTELLIGRARRGGRDDLVQKLEAVRAKFEKLQTDPELREHLDGLSTLVNTPYRLSQNKLDRAAVAQGENNEALWYSNEAPWLLAWARDGYNVFDLAPDFVAAMLLTDPSEIDLPSLKLPFRGMLFMIPDRFAIGADDTSYTKIHVVETDDSRIFDADVVPRDGEKRPAIAIYATDGTRLLSTIAPRAELSWASLEELPDEVSLDADKEARKTIQRVVFGALAYATAVDRAITERFPRAKKPDSRHRATIKHWTIGREIKISPELVRVARAGAREIAFQIKSRFMVRGHYRNQAHGPNHSLRTSKWIMPHWKGPEEGARLVHTYKPTLPEAKPLSIVPPRGDTRDGEG